MNGKLTSRKFWITVLTWITGACTAILAALNGNEPLLGGGLGLMAFATGSYLKAEKDIDMARQEAEAAELYHICHHPPKE